MDFVPILRLLSQDIWDAKVKLVRHADSRWNLETILRSGYLDEYQARQRRPIFHNLDYILSFIGELGSRSRFVGCYRVEGFDENPGPYPACFPYPEMGLGNYRYRLTKVPGFESVEDRLVIDWGAGTRSWVQRLAPKTMVEILPAGHVADFAGYDDCVLTFAQLSKIVEHPDANRVWHRVLSAVAGVYLITDEVSGNLYVGSAYGKLGILGRWRRYARTKHGGNQLLKALLAEDPGRHSAFLFSILRTVPKSMTAHEVISIESLYKKKLGTRAFGLNGN